METTRRGFFGLVAGLVGASVAAPVVAAAPAASMTDLSLATYSQALKEFSALPVMVNPYLTDKLDWYIGTPFTSDRGTLFVHPDTYDALAKIGGVYGISGGNEA